MLSDKAVKFSVYLAGLLIIVCGVLVGVNVSLAGTVKLPKTGQTTCYNEAGSVVSCAGTGQDGDVRAGVAWPSPRFTDNGDGTITDNLTGLMWLKSGNCFGIKAWQEALDAITALNASPGSYTCGGYTGTYNDWVMPNINELESLVNAEDSDPATWLNGQGFLNVQSYIYLSSTHYAGYSSLKWAVDMDTGYVDYYTGDNYVWPVRAGQSEAFPAPVWRTGQTTSYAAGDDGALQRGIEWPAPRFTDNGDGTVSDNLTGLMWLKDASCFGTDGWQDALDSVADFNVNPGGYSCTWYTASYNNWRLPNRKELRSLIDHSQDDPALPSGYPFINVKTSWYWSSTTNPSYTTDAWDLYTRYGAVDDSGKSYSRYIWPVRGGIDPPTVTTAAISSITSTSASSGGNVTSEGGASVTAKGVCWNTSANPTTSNSKTTDGAGTGSFTSSITGLSTGTTYHVRAYATNNVGTSYGSDAAFTTSTTASTVTTTAVSSITANSASSGGNITADGGASVTAKGVCWGTSINPTTSDSHTSDGIGTGSFTSSITGLIPGTTYHVRAYATNNVGTSYGNDLPFTTSTIAPTVTTASISGITSTNAISGGNVSSDGGASVTAKGVCWSNSANPTTSDSHTSDGIGTGSFTSSITGLSQGTPYHVRAYATNSQGTSYGSDLTFTTSATAPTVTTTAISAITTSTATGGGNITSDGGATITARGVCWSTSANPTIADTKTTNGSGVGIFTSSITGLFSGTAYYIRAYATNSQGTAYGSDIPFTTLSLPQCPECSDSPVDLTGVIFGEDTACECSDAVSITLGDGVTIESGANITFKAPRVNIKSGFHAKPGATVRIKQE